MSLPSERADTIEKINTWRVGQGRVMNKAREAGGKSRGSGDFSPGPGGPHGDV